MKLWYYVGEGVKDKELVLSTVLIKLNLCIFLDCAFNTCKLNAEVWRHVTMVAKFLDLNLSLQRKPFALSNDERLKKRGLPFWSWVTKSCTGNSHKSCQSFFSFCSAIFARPRFCWDQEFFANMATWRNDFPLIKRRTLVVEWCLRAVSVMAAVRITCHSSNEAIVGAFEVHWPVKVIHSVCPKAVARTVWRWTIPTSEVMDAVFFAVAMLALPKLQKIA